MKNVLCISAILLIIIGCAPGVFAKPAQVTIKSFESDTRFNGVSAVLMQKGDDQYYINPACNDSSWRTSSLPFGKNDYEFLGTNENDIYWYRIHVAFPKELPVETLGLSLGKIADVDETYLNGHRIGSTGKFDGYKNHACNKVRLYQIPTKYIIAGADNVIAIKVKNTYRADEMPGRGDFYFGNYDQMISSFYMAGMRDLVFPIVYFVFFGYFGLLYYKRTKQTENFFYSFFSLCFAVYSFSRTDIKYAIFDNFYVLQKLEFGSMFLAFATLMSFMLVFFKFRHRIIHYIYWGLTAIYVIGLILLKDHMSWYTYNVTIVQYTWLIPMGTMFYILAKKLRTDRDARTMILSIFIILLGIIHDILLSRGNQIFSFINFWISPFTMFLFTLSIAMVLSIRFADIMNEIEDLNANLEQKVEQRTKELQVANDELGAAMEELEAMNDNLVQTNRELEDAKRIADRDMKMAVQVQTSFFPSKATKTDRWDTEFIFKPMSGVAGDLYDFYEHDGKLRGVALFDVSGHGIASGLLTMLARSIIFREFNAGLNSKLSVVIERINDQLIKEIGNIGNYLTGIILRFNDDGSIEYVNAGHTDLILKRGTKNSVVTVDSKGKSFKGNFIGIELMRSEFLTLSFTPVSDDVIVVYSDCLIESTNEQNEQFGIEGIRSSLMQIPADADAKRIITALEKDFYTFTGTDSLKDDLTVLVIKRK